MRKRSSTTFLGLIIGVKLVMTLFTAFVYSKFTTFSDAENYLNYGIKNDVLLNRGEITETIFSNLNVFVGSELVVHLLSSIICGVIIWYSILPFLNRIDMRLFWVCFLLPNFLVYAGYVGKEIIGITGFFVLLRFMALLIDNRRPSFLLHLPLILLAFLIRPHYALAYAWLLLACWILYGMRQGAIHSLFVHALPVLSAGAMLLIVLTLGEYLTLIYSFTLSKVEQYFLASGRAAASRYWLHIGDLSDFIVNMWWGIPAAIVGPLPQEVVQRPMFLPIFIEGVISLLLIGYLIARCLGATTKDETARRMVILGIIPAIVMALLIHYPFGVFNPGSAIRYKQNLAPLLYFFPIMFLAVVETARPALRVRPAPPVLGAQTRKGSRIGG